MNALISLLFESAFFGFSVWTFIWVFIRNSKAKTKQTETLDAIEAKDRNTMVSDIDRVSIMLVLAFGFYHAATIASNFSQLFFYSTRPFGPHWYGFWMYPFTYFFMTQLLWIKTMTRSVFFRIFYAILIAFVVNYESAVITLTSLHRDREASNLPILFGAHLIFNIFVFALMVAPGIFFYRRYRT